MITYVIPVKENGGHEKNVIRVSNEMSKRNSIFSKYNYAIENSGMELNKDNYFIFMHDDVTILDENLEAKIDIIMKADSETMVLGVIGTTFYDPYNFGTGWWRNRRESHGAGSIVQGSSSGEFLMKEVLGTRFRNKMIVVDGCMLIIRASLFKEIKFDDVNFKSYHHYDADICLQTIHKGYKVSVAELKIKHESVGELDQTYFSEGEIFLNKWKNKFVYPLFIK